MRLQHMFVFAVLMATAASPAQTSTSGGLTGVITDQSNALLPNAGVQIKESEKGILQTTTTDQVGVYHFFFVSPGKYELTVSHDGFRVEKRAVIVLLGPPVSVDVKMDIAKTTTTVVCWFSVKWRSSVLR